ncbi:protein [Escherichia coli]|nr:protein [Escherichia coli]SVF53806.1 protein [Escherichia coli]
MFRSLFLAAALMAFTPLAANAGEITLLPSIKLQIGDRDHYGNYWDGGHWRDRDYWIAIMSGAKTVGGVMIMATTVAGISVKRMSVAIVKAGAIVTIIAEKAGVMGTAIKRVRQWSTMPDATLVRLIRPTNRLFNA